MRQRLQQVIYLARQYLPFGVERLQNFTAELLIRDHPQPLAALQFKFIAEVERTVAADIIEERHKIYQPFLNGSLSRAVVIIPDAGLVYSRKCSAQILMKLQIRMRYLQRPEFVHPLYYMKRLLLFQHQYDLIAQARLFHLFIYLFLNGLTHQVSRMRFNGKSEPLFQAYAAKYPRGIIHKALVVERLYVLLFYIAHAVKKVYQKARTIIIPKRPFLLFQDSDLEVIRDIFIEDIKNEDNS